MKMKSLKGSWLPQSEERATRDLRVGSLNPSLGVEITYIHKFKNFLNGFEKFKKNEVSKRQKYIQI